MKIKNLLPFVITEKGDIGIADAQGPFASTAWCISDEAFNSIMGKKFGWFAPDGGCYTDDRNIFSRPSEQTVINKITPALKQKALELGLIEL